MWASLPSIPCDSSRYHSGLAKTLKSLLFPRSSGPSSTTTLRYWHPGFSARATIETGRSRETSIPYAVFGVPAWSLSHSVRRVVLSHEGKVSSHSCSMSRGLARQCCTRAACTRRRLRMGMPTWRSRSRAARPTNASLNDSVPHIGSSRTTSYQHWVSQGGVCCSASTRLANVSLTSPPFVRVKESCHSDSSGLSAADVVSTVPLCRLDCAFAYCRLG